MTFKESPNVSDLVWIQSPTNPNELIPSREKVTESFI